MNHHSLANQQHQRPLEILLVLLTMVYSTVPVQVIECSGEGVLVGDEGSFWSSDLSNESRKSSLENSMSTIDDWDPFQHDMPQFPTSSTPNTQYHILFKVPKPTVALPPLEDLKYPKEADGGNEDGVASDSHCMSSIIRLAPRGRVVNARARVEMLQHQLGKPFRKLSAGTRIVALTGPFECFKEKNEGKQLFSQDETVDGRSSNSAQTRNQCSSREAPDSTHHKGLKDKISDNFNYIDWWRDGEEGIAQGHEGKDFRRLYSCNFWPVDTQKSADPPGRYYKTEQAVQFYFYNDFSVETIQQGGFAAPSERPFIDASPAEVKVDDDDNSVFILQDGLD
jgi:hypothetical protein